MECLDPNWAQTFTFLRSGRRKTLVKILAAIANYGTKNDCYLQRLLTEFRGMRDRVDVVVTSNLAKNLGPDIEVIAGLPHKDPKSLPFAHKQIFADRVDAYDLFIYAEDDNLITQRNIDAFLRANQILPSGELAGFLRTEHDTSGRLYFSEPHNHFHWDPASACRRGEFTYAFYTNDHSGCYMLTAEQLRRAIASGGYLLPFYHEKYPPLETAATDPYTRCGFRRMICISHMDDFLVPHLSNQYAGTSAQPAEDFYAQLQALASVGQNGKPKTVLFPIETNLYHRHWSKSYYEPLQEQTLALIPEGVRTALSVGCGWGATEKVLLDKGLRVKAVPLDSVIAASARLKGIEIVYGNLETARKQLEHERFDCVLMTNVLHLVPDPVGLLARYSELLTQEGCVVASVPNLPLLRRIARRIRLRGHATNPVNYRVSGMHRTTGRIVRRWFQQAGLKVKTLVYEAGREKELANALSLGLAKESLGANVNILAYPTGKGESFRAEAKEKR
jgi:2-polyprenyl-3-methyl-5-hydroxy-6-metoxy-1,4-benzoquinol methylase